jgi:hypothetical protein
VSVRLIGDPDACARLAQILTGHPDLEMISGPRGPYACDTEPGARWYVTVRPLEDMSMTLHGAAHNRQAIRRPVAPARRHHR